MDAVGIGLRHAASRRPGLPGVPSQASRWAIEAVAKAGTIGIIGVYSPDFETYPIGQAMNKT